METLKVTTRPLHDATEAHEFQKLLGSGKLPQATYIDYLSQLYRLHKHLADYLAKHLDESSKLKGIVKNRHLVVDSLTADLDHFEVALENAVPTGGTRKLLKEMARMDKESPCALLGILYVLEGSTHGAKYMVSKLRDGLGLKDRIGASYFDRYQDAQMPNWLEFKADMNAAEFDQDESQAIVDSAKRTFAAFFEIGNDLMAIR